MRKIELLAPARNADIGIEAIRHGADAVYIGAGRFGARAAAANSVEDIKRLVDFAHLYRAKVYVTVNTIMSDDELDEAERLIHSLYEAGVDALIVQDMGLLRLNLPPIPLHASTQMDNRTAEKVRFLRSEGFEQVVLARELTLEQIRDIHRECPDVLLETFVHGALCVSYSGQCYVSEACFGRSANRGECAQVCRMEFDLEDTDGHKLLKRKHLLSLKDLCHIDALEDLLEAGASSLKIEGRLKDMSYVKNITAAYSCALNEIIKRHPDSYERASAGEVRLKFQPDVRKSFNRGFTHYFLYGRGDDIFSFDTPKALGEEVGKVKDVFSNHFTVAGVKSFANGDGLCFVDGNGKLQGFRVNKVVDGKLFPLEMPDGLRSKLRLYRNYDHTFEQILARESAERIIPVDIDVDETADGFLLRMSDSEGYYDASLDVTYPKELARTPQTDNVKRQLSRLGGTGLELRDCRLNYKKNYFIPSSVLGEWRRQLVSRLLTPHSSSLTPHSSYATSFLGCNWLRLSQSRLGIVQKAFDTPLAVPSIQQSSSKLGSAFGLCENSSLTYLTNVMNSRAAAFYREHGAVDVEPAFELKHRPDVPLMFCRHCLRFALGMCAKNQRSSAHAPRQSLLTPHSSLYLILANGRRFRLEFDCKQCLMKVYLEQNK